MRALALIAILLLAGCAAPADDVAIPDEAPRPLPEDVRIDEAGDMVSGVDKTWTWDVDERYQRFDASICWDGLEGADFFLIHDYTLGLTNQNGTVGEVREGPGTSIMSGTPGCITHAVTRAGDINATGIWTATVRAASSPATWSVQVDVLY